MIAQCDSPGLRRKSVTTLSPLRYPGSKRRLAEYIAQTLLSNRLKPELFVEPFAGGASVALQLLADGVVDRIGLSDLDPLVASFWKTVFFDSEWLVEMIESVDVSLEQWEYYKYTPATTRRERAIACLFLNRTSFSGILTHRAGPIGGKAQESDYKIDCRFPRDTLIKRVRQAAALRSRVAFVWNVSWKRTLSLVTEGQQRGKWPAEVCFYFDPPFFEKADVLYSYYFEASDHRRLRNAVLELDTPWILSYDPAPAVEDLYGNVQLGNAHVEMLYSTAGKTASRRAAREVIISNLPVLPNQRRHWALVPDEDLPSSSRAPFLSSSHSVTERDFCCPCDRRQAP